MKYMFGVICLSVQASILLHGVEADAQPLTEPAAVTATLAPANAALQDAHTVANVLSYVHVVLDELEHIRFEMGKPVNKQRDIEVEGASLRDAYFQALTMAQKTRRLLYERTGQQSDTPQRLTVDMITSEDVWQMVDVSVRRIRTVKETLAMRAVVKEVRQDEQVTAKDIFTHCVRANRQLNLLLTQKFSPSDVFQQVTRASNYAAQLSASFPHLHRRPLAPAYVHGKTPSDVYRKLLQVLEITEAIADASGLKGITIHHNDNDIIDATPSDVYDIASLLNAKLSYLHAQTADPAAPVSAYFPGDKFPSHVFQRAGMLEAQMVALRAAVTANPDWLARTHDEKK